MKCVSNLMLAAAAVWFVVPLGAGLVVIEIDLHEKLHPISPLIYGSNHEVHGFRFMDSRRLGGNRLTPCNWEIDASNASKDFKHQNDRWLTATDWWNDTTTSEWVKTEGSPANAVKRFHGESLSRNAYSLVTVPMAGYAAADADGPLHESEAAPSPRGSRPVSTPANHKPCRGKTTRFMSTNSSRTSSTVSARVDRHGHPRLQPRQRACAMAQDPPTPSTHTSHVRRTAGQVDRHRCRDQVGRPRRRGIRPPHCGV